MNRAASLLILVSTVLWTGCGSLEIREMASDLCSSLVVRKAPMSDQEAICHLPQDTKLLSLLPPGVLGANASLTLRESLLSLREFNDVRTAQNGTKWFRFPSTIGTLEAGCTPHDSGTAEDTCVWHLTATGLPDQLTLDERLQRLVTAVGTNEGTNSTLHVLSSPRGNGSQEQVSLHLYAKRIRQLDWIDPQETAGLKPPWSK